LEKDGQAHSERSGDPGHGVNETPIQTGKWYEILEVPQSATEEVIKAAYRRLIKQYHPDLVGPWLGRRQMLSQKSSTQHTKKHWCDSRNALRHQAPDD
jgi:DnaJ domain